MEWLILIFLAGYICLMLYACFFEDWLEDRRKAKRREIVQLQSSVREWEAYAKKWQRRALKCKESEALKIHGINKLNEDLAKQIAFNKQIMADMDLLKKALDTVNDSLSKKEDECIGLRQKSDLNDAKYDTLKSEIKRIHTDIFGLLDIADRVLDSEKLETRDQLDQVLHTGADPEDVLNEDGRPNGPVELDEDEDEML